MKPDYELQLQRLIDGELSQDQRSRFLQAIDAQPERWREVALAYVEDQTWQAFAREQSVDDGHAATRIAKRTETVAKPESEPEVKSPLPPRRRWIGFGPPMFMMAATVLFVLTLVVRFNTPQQNGVQNTLAGGAAANETQPVSHNEPAYKLQMGDVDIPLYSQLDQLPDRFLDVGFQVEPVIQQQLLDSGIVMEPNLRFISGRADDGRTFLIPVSGLRFKQYIQ